MGLLGNLSVCLGPEPTSEEVHFAPLDSRPAREEAAAHQAGVNTRRPSIGRGIDLS
jgi:hypothetical protein